MPAELQPFLTAVEEAYQQSDRDRAMLEHSMEVVSAELGDRFRLSEALQASKQAEEQLSRALSVLAATLESTADAVLVTAFGKIVRTNQRFIDMWRHPQPSGESLDYDEAIRNASRQVRDPEQFLDRITQINAHAEEESFDVLHFKDGRIIERYSRPQRVRGETVGRVWSFRDVTERRELEHQLRQAQKMESVGRLAGGVAHDFNNILTVITGRVDFLIGAANLTEEQGGDLDEIRVAADRAGDLTRQLLAFSRQQLLQPRIVDLNCKVDELEPMLRRLIGEDIQIAVCRGENLRSVMADPGQLNQVLLNLALNARDAMPSGGQLTIRTANEAGDVSSSRGHRSAGACDDAVVLEVTDTGCGMDEVTAAQIFEPFFTTKREGKGTGLGLATVYGIVKQSGGSISVRTAPGMGTTFWIRFPVANVDVPAEVEPEPELDDAGSETILLVEDDDAVRDLTRRVLEKRGYKVLTAQNGREALAIASVSDQQLHLVLTDVIMPEMSGREFVEALHRSGPRTPVLYMSGYTDDEIIRRGLIDSSFAFLQKPFTPQALARRVRTVLDGA